MEQEMKGDSLQSASQMWEAVKFPIGAHIPLVSMVISKYFFLLIYVYFFK